MEWSLQTWIDPLAGVHRCAKCEMQPADEVVTNKVVVVREKLILGARSETSVSGFFRGEITVLINSIEERHRQQAVWSKEPFNWVLLLAMTVLLTLLACPCILRAVVGARMPVRSRPHIVV